MSDDDITRLRLPHTGLRVPDRSITLTNYRARATDDGAWFRASVNVHGKKVGMVANDGFGGPTGLTSTEEVFADLDVYAGQCLTEEGDKVTNLEELLDELVAEHEWLLKVADAATRGVLLLRLMAFTLVGDDNEPVDGFPPRPDGSTTAAIPPGTKHWAALHRALVDTPNLAPGEHGWWQAWHKDRWQDVTARPTRVASHLYT